MTGGTDVTLNLLGLVAAFILIALNAAFVAAEFAIVKIRRTRLEELAGQGVSAARVSLLSLDQLDQTLSATQLGITMASLGLGWIGELAFEGLISLVLPERFPVAFVTRHLVAGTLAFFTITLLHVVLGELVPKHIAIQDAERMTLLLGGPLRAFHQAMRPLLMLFTRLARLVLHTLGYTGTEEDPLTENELKLVMKESREDGIISDSEAQIINRAFEFADKRASDIMVPRERVDYLSLSKGVDQNVALVKAKQRTRFPLCRTGFDDVVGVVHMKDVWPELLARFSNEAFQAKARAPIFVGPSLKQDQLLRLFQSCRGHLAIVRDETGRHLGIVTLEDVLERLVGDIRDEHGN